MHFLVLYEPFEFVLEIKKSVFFLFQFSCPGNSDHFASAKRKCRRKTDFLVFTSAIF